MPRIGLAEALVKAGIWQRNRLSFLGTPLKPSRDGKHQEEYLQGLEQAPAQHAWKPLSNKKPNKEYPWDLRARADSGLMANLIHPCEISRAMTSGEPGLWLGIPHGGQCRAGRNGTLGVSPTGNGNGCEC